MTKFDRNEIEKIKSSVDLVEIIGKYVKLQKRGKEYIGLCPFHIERTPSFTVVPDKDFYHCFGCGQNGDVIDFIKEQEAVNFTEAIEILAELAGVEIKKSDAWKKEFEAVKINTSVMELYEKAGNDMVKKFFDERKLDKSLIDEFHVGYAQPDSSNVLRKLSDRVDLLLELGLVFRGRDGKYKERFLNRFVFPVIHSRYPVGFGARWHGDSYHAKYINSKESFLYDKGRSLFGLAQAKKHIRNSGSVYLVEGYTDVLAFWTAGVKNVVASCGTALTVNQVRIISRMTDNIHIVYDPDSAGRLKAYKAVLQSLAFGLVPYIVDLGKFDPNDFLINLGEDELAKKLQSGSVFYEYYSRLLENRPIQKKIKVVKEFKESASKIIDGVTRGVLINEIVSYFGIHHSDDLRTKVVANISIGLESQLLAGFMDPKFSGYLFSILSIDDIAEHKDLFSFLFDSHKNGEKVTVKSLMSNFKESSDFISDALFPATRFDRESIFRLAVNARRRTIERKMEALDLSDPDFEILRNQKILLENLTPEPPF